MISPKIADHCLLLYHLDKFLCTPLCRVLSGILFGVFQAIGKVYNAEIAHRDLRGSLGTVISNMSAVGMIYTYTTGYFIHRSVWR